MEYFLSTISFLERSGRFVHSIIENYSANGSQSTFKDRMGKVAARSYRCGSGVCRKALAA
jgi:hypothetical protein